MEKISTIPQWGSRWCAVVMSSKSTSRLRIICKAFRAFCGSEVGKIVDVNVPLILNYRGINICKDKGLGYY